MTRSDWMVVYIKVIGVWSILTGATSLVNSAGLMGALEGPFKVPFLGHLLSSAIWLGAGLFLILRTATCLQWLGEPKIPN